MRIGVAIEKPYRNPEEWYQLIRELGCLLVWITPSERGVCV